MTSSSATATFLSFSSAGRQKKYDVFISFRGEDTRNNFTSHLNAALHRRNIETYIDDRLDRGDVISQAIIKAIEDSYILLIVFSENYASSKWCLDELIKIIECKELEGKVVIPVFYKIDPSHVRKQLGSYKIAFAKHERDFKHNKEKVLRWKSALTKVANLAGRTDYEFIEQIVKDVLPKLNHMYPRELRGLVGVEQNCRRIESLLAINPSQVQIIGLWGMGGIGKTTLSAVLYAKLSCQYEGRCFLENVSTESKKYGLNYLRNRLTSELLGEENLHICTPQVASAFVLSRLNHKKFFIVLDDVNTLEQLEYLVGEHDWLGLGSRVIVTTRDKHVLSRGVDEIYEVKELNFKDSLQLFRMNALNNAYHDMQYVEQSTRAVIYASGIPLALKILGAFLRSKSKEEWDNALRKLQKFPRREIQDVLKLSYDDLDDKDKDIFLDIACFLKGWDKNDVTRLLENFDFYPDIGIRNLVDKALITISPYNTVEMHDLIQEMGWEIVRQECIKDPGKRSRLWVPEEVYQVLKYNRGTDAIESMLLDGSQIGDLYLASDVFKNMINLRLLKFSAHGSDRCNIYLPSGLETLPDKLSYLYWDQYPLKSLPSSFCAEKLVALSMIDSHVEKLWDGVQNLPNLKEFILSGSKQLLELPDLSRASNLKSIYLRGCTSLCEVHPSILSLPKLKRLNLIDCKALKSLRSNSPLKSLKYLSVIGCSSLQEFSVTSKQRSYLWSTEKDELLPSMLLFEKLDYLAFRLTENSCKLDTILDSLQNLRELDLSECTLSELPDNINQLVYLQSSLSLDRSHLVRLPANIKHLSWLVYLGLYKCRKLQYLPELPPLFELDARECTSLKTVSCSVHEDHSKSAVSYLFENCIRLGQHAVDSMMADAHVRIIQAANIISKEDYLDEDDDDDDDDEVDLDNGKISFCLPGNEFPDWFSYCSTKALLTIELPSPSKLLGFAFCVILAAESSAMDHIDNLGCECSLEADDGETVNIKSWFINNCLSHVGEDKLISDHVYLWYDARYSSLIRDQIEHSRENYSLKFSFTFFTKSQYDKRMAMSPCEVEHYMKEVMIRLCGVQPIYASEDPPIGDEGRIESSQSMETHESISLPKMTRQVIPPPLWKQNEMKGLKEILFMDC